MAYRSSSTPADERIRAARASCLERDRLVALRAALGADQARAAARVHALAEGVRAETEDVARYEAGVWAFLYDLFADREARLTKEQAEARAAQVRFEDESRAHDRLVEELAAIDGRLAGLAHVDHELATARAGKIAETLAAGGSAAAHLEEIGREAAANHAARVQTQEAMAAGARALASLDALAATLAIARSWGQLDMMLNSTWVSASKRDQLDEARGRVGVVQAELIVFQRELGDLGVRLDVQITALADERRFMDVFFDNIFTDVRVQNRIVEAQASTAQVIAGVRHQLALLDAHARDLATRAHALATAEHHLTEPA